MQKTGLYEPLFEHDSCGVGFVADSNGIKSHQTVKDGITILNNLIHRGAIGGDGKTGDGAGILIQIPHSFFESKCQKNALVLPEAGEYGIGMIFIPINLEERKIAKSIIENTIINEGGTFLGWRDVPTNPECLGKIAKESMPHICQFFALFNQFKGEELERKLYIVRRMIEKKALENGFSYKDFYIVSLSSQTITYKGMLVGNQLEEFYPDLANTKCESAIAVIHQRYSTNTFPSWPLAQPFRAIAHNGEINTLRGNINKMRAREAMLCSSFKDFDLKKLLPIIDSNLSDSAIFDNVFELLIRFGRSVEHSMMMMVPEPFGNKFYMSEDRRAFYEYHAAIMEPWDGPAAIAFTDGNKVGISLDRNGLRPVRFVITKTGRVIAASEIGVIDIAPEEILQKGKLGPGKMLMVDTLNHRIFSDNEIKAMVSRQKPYRRWLENNRIELKGLFTTPSNITLNNDLFPILQKVWGYTLEEITMIIAPMAENAQEPVLSMGNDTALAVLSEKPQLLFNYFKQLFAQVTNPPIDPYRENLVMSLMSFIGKEGNLLEETPSHCHQLKLSHPVLTNEDINKLKNANMSGVKSKVLFMAFKKSEKDPALELSNTLDLLCKEAEKFIDEGCTLIILSDRGINENMVPIPSLMCVSYIHQYLIKAGKRQMAGIIVETGEARDVMHFATLIGFGASAINPYLALETIASLCINGFLPENLKIETAIDNYISAIKKGLLKIMSKMGVSTIRSYMGSQLFEAIGLNRTFIDKYFPNTISRIGGVGLDIIVLETLARHNSAFSTKIKNSFFLESGGSIHYRKEGEKHLLSPEAITLLQRAVRENDYNIYLKYSETISNSTNLCTLRGLFKFKKRESVPINEVESEENIINRFVSSAMSFGSISKEAHETIAIAMNRLKAASNSGEGGEDELRYIPLPNGDSMKSAIKQVASGRFGVTCNYLVNSKELQIKIAQGAKPGEGGQLPAHKVDPIIAKVRNSTPWVQLISPPPHHDIYSIEDLAQLIYDLKNVNPEARVSVKLVAEAGVGTVAAGVAKAKADMVLISGHDGGTGASPISSIKCAGIPWEIGLSETHQTLILNGLRDKIRIQVDGQMRTGRDVVIAALLGAEEFGFGTIVLVTLGCIMMRKCHQNTCPVGVATQDPLLRKRFCGKPEYVMNFMRFVAREVRQIMSELGFKTVNEMVGHTEILEINNELTNDKTKGLDFSGIFAASSFPAEYPKRCYGSNPIDLSNCLDIDLIKKSKIALEEKQSVSLFASIKNSNRSVGAMLSGEVSKRYGSKGLLDNTIHCKFKGSAGQSFGAFLARGITFELEGETNDYAGKGLSGGRLIIYPPKSSTFRSSNNVIAGNVCLYGATGGEAYISGLAGERFCVRNSGAFAVVEGVGDHGCEYMTGGIVVVLGTTGVNFAAGMSGGIAFVLDETQLFDTKCNLEMVNIEPVTVSSDIKILKSLIEKHLYYTNSETASRILKNWDETLTMFVKVMPVDYKKALERIKKEDYIKGETAIVTEEVFN
jgi:glutamate synthase domain-containing protein 2/glutamate synthase domain-containing protein 1/glutamate synthase domain-containing protein 3